MARKQSRRRDLPEDVLDDVLWSFTEGPFPDRAAFDAAVRQYQIDIQQGEDSWRPEEVVLPCSLVRITCEWWEEGWAEEEVEPIIPLTADNGTSFTAGELLFKVHNTVMAQGNMGDHHFFEGLSRKRTRDPNEAPLYEIETGS
jgi:hypothetical protein